VSLLLQKKEESSFNDKPTTLGSKKMISVSYISSIFFRPARFRQQKVQLKENHHHLQVHSSDQCNPV